MYPLKTKSRYTPGSIALTANIFTTVYLGNYVSGNFDEGVGSHCGVDIFPITSHDDVFACLDGIVEVAQKKDANGNYVIIRHDNVPDPRDMTQLTTLYSCYLHLSEYSVTAGQLVSEGDVIGKSGNTGNVSGSTGEHLHFQIDRKEAPFHPYWPFSFAEAQAQNLGFFEAVNKGLGMDNARKYTVDPLVYLDKIESYTPLNSLVTTNSSTTTTISSTTISTTILGDRTDNESTDLSFQDVSADHTYATAIGFLKSKNIVSGNNGLFLPDATITRAELLKMVFLAANVPLVSGDKNYFSDVPSTSWQASYANTAKVNKIIGGYSDGTFRPNNPITRAEAFKIIINTLHPEALDSLSFSVFDDVSLDVWYAPYAAFAKAEHLIRFSLNNFEPDRLMSRAEVASAICILMS